MAITNYGELKTELQSYLYNRQDLTSIIPTFITLGEKKIFRLLESEVNEKVDTGTMVNEYISLPSDYKSTKALTINDRPLRRVSEITLKQMLKDDNAGGEPTVFARWDDKLYTWRTRDSQYDYWLLYYADLSGGLSLDADTNVVLTAYPDLYLYAALIEAMPYLVKDQRTPAWVQMFEDAMNDINESTFHEEYSGAVNQVSSVYDGR